MRKYLFFAMFAAAALVTGMAACSSDDDNPAIEPEGDEDEYFDPMKRDALQHFQNAIVSSDAADTSFDGFHWGKELYPETDPGHLYIGVDTWEEAERMFRRYWLLPTVKPVLLPPSALALKAPLPDVNGVEKMHALLQPGTSDDVVAELTVNKPELLKHFYKITFLKNEAWPEEPSKARRRASKNYTWHVGDVLKNVTLTSNHDYHDYLDDDDEALDFVCIRSAGNGVKPWFLSVSRHNTYKVGNCYSRPTYAHLRLMKYVPDYDTAEQLDSLVNENWDLIMNAWDECSTIGEKPGSCSGNEPFLDACGNTWYWYNYNLKTGESEGFTQGKSGPLFFQIDFYEDDELEDNMTAFCNTRSNATRKNGNTCGICTPD